MSREIIIIDGSSLVHRAFYALPISMTAAGRHTNAVYGFTTMLLKLLAERKPGAVAVAFDKGKVTFRNGLYEAYKMHRPSTPSELTEQFPLVQEILDAFGIKTLAQDGYEGDDIIGTLAAKAVADGYDAVIVTGDRDVLQLIGPHTKVMLTKKGITEMDEMDSQAVKTKYGIEPETVVDLKGLTGDKSDNIPGVPGVGEKTAVKLLTEFGTVENILDQIDAVSGEKLRENLRKHAELARLSKKLATIICDMPLPFQWEDFQVHPDYDKVHEVFTKFQFRRLLANLPELAGEKMEKSGSPLEPAIKQTVRILDAENESQDAVKLIRAAGSMIFLPVVSGRMPDSRLEGLAVSVGGEILLIETKSKGWREIAALLADESIQKITYDTKNLFNVCRSSGIEAGGPLFDILLAAYLLNSAAASYSLAELAGQYLVGTVSAADFGKDKGNDLAAQVGTICSLHPVFAAKLADDGLDKLYYEVELPLASVLSSMELAGIRVDIERLKTMTTDLSIQVDALLHNIYQLAGEEFNVNSPKQLGSILFDKLNLPVIKKTKTGYSTDAEVLDKLAGLHPLIDQLQEYRLLIKLKSTYLDTMPSLINPHSGRIHTSFNQAVTTTGRLSSSEPNLQNIPVRTEIGRRIRELFIPGDQWKYMMAADYSQIELRILAHLSADPGLLDAFRNNQDIHARTASEVFGVPLAEVTPEMRSRAKAVNFGIIYGISDYGLARNTGVSRKEAGQYIDLYFSRYGGVKEYMDRMVAEARRLGYVTTLFGRRRYLPDIHSSNFSQRSFAERTAMNTPVQGSAADIIKKAMIDVSRALAANQIKSRVLLQVHDELVLEVAQGEEEIAATLVRQAMENAVALDVKLTVDVKMGKNWAETK
ncbi:MAG: polymerase [Firmicutes bacterium]|nr:polymerase [Bacillota bacterium]